VFGEGDSGGDMGEVREGLGEVAQGLVGMWVVLLREESQLVAGGDSLIEDLSGVLDPALPGEAFGEPERAGQEGTLHPFQVTLCVCAGTVAQKQAASVELIPDGIGRPDHTLVSVGDELEAWDQEQCGVEVLASEGLDEGAAVFVVALAFDSLADLIPGL
jgi:hypothetical protein